MVLYGLDKANVPLKPTEEGLCGIHTVHWPGAGSMHMDEWHPCQIFNLPRMLSVVIKTTHVSWRLVDKQHLIRLFPSFVAATIGLNVISGEFFKNIKRSIQEFVS